MKQRLLLLLVIMIRSFTPSTSFLRTASKSRLLSPRPAARLTRNKSSRALVLSSNYPGPRTWAFTLGMTAAVASFSNQTAYCEPLTGFGEDYLETDHYNGVTIRLDKMTDSMDADSFRSILKDSLDQWRGEEKKGIWIHCPKSQADKVPVATELGFDFHMVTNHALILSQWLPDTPSRLPHAPTHQVGVGCLILYPKDPSKMLVVQEKTGPAAAWSLWKVPTGLTDPMEDIPEAAVRELKEETGLDATFKGILAFRQAHRGGYRAVSDLYFVCVMDLVEKDNIVWNMCEDEIADIKWMPVKEYCGQERWQGSPVYLELNNAILEASKQTLFGGQTLELGFGGSKSTNVIYKSKL